MGYTIGKLAVVNGIGTTAVSMSPGSAMSFWVVPTAAEYQSVSVTVYGYQNMRAYVQNNRLFIWNDSGTTIPSGVTFVFMAVYVTA